MPISNSSTTWGIPIFKCCLPSYRNPSHTFFGISLLLGNSCPILQWGNPSSDATLKHSNGSCSLKVLVHFLPTTHSSVHKPLCWQMHFKTSEPRGIPQSTCLGTSALSCKIAEDRASKAKVPTLYLTCIHIHCTCSNKMQGMLIVSSQSSSTWKAI